MPEHLHLVTGRLAEPSLRRVLATLSDELPLGYSVDVLPITVAALMTPDWIAKRVAAPAASSRVIVPGYCEGDLSPIQQATGKPVERGPRDLRDLPRFLGGTNRPPEYGAHRIEIIAEINHCPRLELAEIVRIGKRLAAEGADVIDIGCEPGGAWAGVGDAVRALRDAGLRVSIDSLNPQEIAPAVAADAELVLSVNSCNREAAADWGCEVIAIPDEPKSLAGLDETIDLLAKQGVPLRVDPILEPIGFGFAASLTRYADVRRRYPDAEMLMGIGNLTELTEVDSAGVNTLLLGFCEELGVRSVLTTQVIPWAATSVKECDLARRLVHHAVSQQTLPKHLDSGLVTLRGGQTTEIAPELLDQLASEIRDPNYRVFAAAGEIHLVGKQLHLHDRDPFVVFQQLLDAVQSGAVDRPIDASHAFYLGHELSKAATALALGKSYEQDESLDWGYLTQPESSHRLARYADRPRG
ncbi:Pterin binding enzyme [Posidoniimonas polymericola]|uniref:Pterin binding enzyme n=1 Tax=Posidoniimonas polymericola TaxID=2528002 RepID=A0A5C5XUQ0_9BACT|nr:DUF6513 domain-containing protein [Posidoniimonas polymericola]TWT66291.1 Pterin binding enzyme [Posidoniimonas polymericola]